MNYLFLMTWIIWFYFWVKDESCTFVMQTYLSCDCLNKVSNNPKVGYNEQGLTKMHLNITLCSIMSSTVFFFSLSKTIHCRLLCLVQTAKQNIYKWFHLPCFSFEKYYCKAESAIAHAIIGSLFKVTYKIAMLFSY